MKKTGRALILMAAFLVAINQSYPQWVRQSIPNDVTMLLATDFYSNGTGVAAGYAWLTDFSGRAIYSTNGGLIWTLAQVPDSARSLVTVSFASPETAYVAGAYNLPALFRQDRLSSSIHDAGLSGATKALGIERYLRRIGLTGGGGYRGLFLASTDAGMTWHTKGHLPDNISYLYGAAFVNASVGYLTADADPQFGLAHILKTMDAGNSWTQLNTPDSIPSLRNITFLDPMIGIAVGYQLRNQTVSGVILRTSDEGDTWVAKEFPAVDNFTDVSFLNSSTGFAVGVYRPPSIRGAIFKTSDAGVTWLPLNYVPDTALLEGVRFAKGTAAGIVYGETQSLAPFVARTTDGGLTWTQGIIDSAPDNSLLIGGRLLTPLVGYLCGGDALSSAVMLHTTNGGVTTVGQYAAQEIQTFSLSQNYPNPFNPTTRIVFSVPHQAYVTLRIFTILGMEVATLVSESLGSGDYTVDWNAKAFPSGMYFYRMQAGAFSKSKKLVLLK